jgi:hypothetical protein
MYSKTPLLAKRNLQRGKHTLNRGNVTRDMLSSPFGVLAPELDALVDKRVKVQIQRLEDQIEDIVTARVQEAVKEAVREAILKLGVENNNKEKADSTYPKQESVTPQGTGQVLGGSLGPGGRNLFQATAQRLSTPVYDEDETESDEEDIDLEAPVEQVDVRDLRAEGMMIVSNMADASLCLEKNLFDPTKANIKNIHFFFDTCLAPINWITYQAFEVQMREWCEETSEMKERCVTTVCQLPNSSIKAGKATWKTFTEQKIFS